jgi:NitT/TauT family transport system permease protein
MAQAPARRPAWPGGSCEAGNRLQIARMFAALFLLAFLGVAIFFVLALVEHWLLRQWHESALKKDI